jgi:hypothetical protein
VSESQKNAEALYLFISGYKSKILWNQKRKSVHEFQDPQWVCDFRFLLNITGRLNKLNCHLQGKDQFVHPLHECIKSFQTKLVVRERQLKKGKI